LLLLASELVAGSCIDDFVINHNNQTAFSISSNLTCSCTQFSGSFSGDGHLLTNLQNQSLIANLTSQIDSLSSQLVTANAEINSLQAQINNKTVFASYAAATSRIVPSPTSGVDLIIFDSVAVDTFNGYDTNTGLFTVPVSGVYHVKAAIIISLPASTSALMANLAICYGEGLSYSSIASESFLLSSATTDPANGACTQTLSISAVFSFGQGAEVSICLYIGGLQNPSLCVDSPSNRLHIVRIGN